MSKVDDLRRRREDLQGEIRRVREHPDYNDAARARRIAPLYRAFAGEEKRVLDEMRAGTAEAAASKGRKAFEAPAMFGADKALVQMNYRHALDSVEGLADHRALEANGYCWAHDPAHAEERRRIASRGGRGKGGGELADLKRQIKGLAADVLDGTADRGCAAVANQLYNTLIRALEQERKQREFEELTERLEAMEEVLKGRKGA